MQMNKFKQNVFFSGINGSGMSAIAIFMAQKGATVSGSDRIFQHNPEHPNIKIFQNNGIKIFPQNGSGIQTSLNLVVFSSAIEKDNLEIIKAKDLDIKIKARSEYLADICLIFQTIAVAGTSGKSITSGMLAFTMNKLGISSNFIGGGNVKQFITEKNIGNSLIGGADILVIEACESDGSIVNYQPQHSILLNIDLDHHSISETTLLFEKFIANTKNLVLINADDKNSQILNVQKKITFSLDTPSQYQAKNIVYQTLSSEFNVDEQKFRLAIPGKFNIYNSMAVIALLSEMGIPKSEISQALSRFSGIERRFDIHLNNDKNLVIDDYAHNPHKISALMNTVKNIKDKVCYIFQPHGFIPTKMMKDEYINTFSLNIRDTDRLLILPIYYVGGSVQRDISSQDIAIKIRHRGKNAEALSNRNEIFIRLSEYNNYVIFGARDATLRILAQDIARLLSERYKS